jgi:hypothetical protein
MEKTEKVFAKGFIFKRNENAPTFVIGNLSLNSKDAAEFIASNTKNGWVNLKINQAQNGKYYVELDTWEAKPSGSGAMTYKTQETKKLVNFEIEDLPTNDLPF